MSIGNVSRRTGRTDERVDERERLRDEVGVGVLLVEQVDL
jgi:hypothetical protein